MADGLSTRGMSDAQVEYVARLHEKLDRVKSAVVQRSGQAIDTAVMAATGFAVGYAEGRYPDRNILGAEPSLAVAIGAGGVALMSNQGTDQEKYTMAAANAGLTAYAFKLGKEAGQKSKAAADAKKQAGNP
jgi:S-adenosylhomocysteine hydrolase